MIGQAACRGAATIVNAIATGRGAAFGITLETDAVVELREGNGEIVLRDSNESPHLPTSCVRAVVSKTIRRRARSTSGRTSRSQEASRAAVQYPTRSSLRQLVQWGAKCPTWTCF
jgi:shikimate kinase